MELERDVERYLIRRVEQAGGVCLKHGQDGWPDRIVILPGGRLIWIETKRRIGVQSDLQKHRIRQLQALGQDARFIWSKDEVDELMHE
jgi:hypothetical protein